MNSEYQKSQLQINQDIICSLSNKERYFIVHPCPQEEFENVNPKSINTNPIVLVYKDNDNTKIIELVKKYDGLAKTTTLTFALESGHILEKSETIGEIKRKLRRSNLDGLELFSEKIYSECALYNMSKVEEIFNQNAIEVPFSIEGGDYSNYLKVKAEDTVRAYDDIVKQITSMIQLEFGKNVDPKSLSIMVISDGKTENLKKTSIAEINENDKIIISAKGIQLTKPKDMKNHLVIKGQQFKGVNVEYESIKNKKIKDILKDLDGSQEWDTFGLMIDDFVLKNYETIESVKEVRALFEPSAGSIKHIVGIVLKESHIFQKEQGKIAEKGKFVLEKHFYKEQKNQEYLQNCNKLIRERAEKAPKLEFKDVQNVTPIFRYTAEIKVFGSLNQKTASSIYRNLNFFLRNQNFAQAIRENYEKMWEYQFNYELLSQLNKLPSITDTVLWRGVDYLPDHFVGEKVLYKQFNSTSMNKDTATGFACEAIFKITKSFSGKLIKDYSYYSTEAEVLFPPYCQFLITKVDQILLEKKNITVKYYEMEQIQKEPLPKNAVNYILWVDDKTLEGKAIWNSFENIKKSTVMKQLLSTAQLEEWLIKYKSLLSDTEMNVSMISNMTRKEGGKLNEIAGVEGIKLFRSYLPKSNIFLYIGNKKLAIEKLQKYGGQTESQILYISSTPSQLKEFLRKNGEIQ